MRVLIDVSRPETIPCTIKDAIIGYVKSLPNRAIEEIESYDRNIQYKNDVMNKQKILRQEKAVTAEIYDLLSQYPVFYITRHFVLNSKKERYITELFSWNDDIKKRIYYKKK